MKETVAKLFQVCRKLLRFYNATLRAEKVQPADGTSAAPRQDGFRVDGRHDGSDGPLAVVLMTVPTRAAHDSAILEFVVRRARAYKAPYFVTWMLSPCDPLVQPQSPARQPPTRRSSATTRPFMKIGEAAKVRSTNRRNWRFSPAGNEIMHDLERLLKDEALQLVQVPPPTASVQHLLPTTHVLHDRLGSDVTFRDELIAWAVKQAIAGDSAHQEFADELIPQFDAIVGNFPYISADQIEKHEAGYLEFLRRRFVSDWFDEYPQGFHHTKRQEQQSFEKLIAQGQHKGGHHAAVQHHISTYADLYVHLFFHTARFLKPGGRMGIVTSNAWGL